MSEAGTVSRRVRRLLGGKDETGPATAMAAAAEVRKGSRFWADWRLWLVVGLALAVRAPGLNRPLLGNFATKNVVYAMIAQNWATGQAPLWHPTLHVLREGGPGLHLLEIPVTAYLAGGLWRWLGGSLDFWGRTVSVVCIVAAVALLYALVRRRHGTAAAVAAAMVLAISPVSIVYGQSFMLEASVALFSIAAVDAADRFAHGNSRLWFAASSLWLCLLVLTKIYMAVMLLPLAWIVFRPTGSAHEEAGSQAGRRAGAYSPLARRSTWKGVVTAALLWAAALAPAVAWYAHVMKITAADSPLAGQFFYSLRNSQEAHRWPPAELLDGDFYRQVLDDVSTVVLTPIGFTLLLLGLYRRETRQQLPWLAAAAIVMLVLPRKFFAMNYYYLSILPPLAIVTGLGWKTLAEALAVVSSEGGSGLSHATDPAARQLRSPAANVAVPALLLAAALLFSLRYAAKPAYVTPEEDRSVLPAAQACRKLVPEGQLVATLHGTTIDLLYYCERQGFVLPPAADKLPAAARSAAERGARFLAVAHLRGLPAESQQWLHTLPKAAAGADYAVYRLSSLAPTATTAPTAKRDLD